MTIEQTKTFAETLGDEGTPCAECGAPLAADQRYCLNCGQRRTHARLPFMEVLENRFRRGSAASGQSPAEPAPGAMATQAAPPSRRIPGDPLNWAAGAAIAAVFTLGIVIGALLDDGSGNKVAAAPRPQVISVAVPAGAGSAAAAPAAEFTADWPEGTEGFTIQLQTLPKDGTEVADVAAAKTAAQGEGATDVGALDSDDYGDLDSGNYVIYSGVFKTRKQARKALGKLEKRFPDARVVAISTGGSSTGAKKKGTVDKNELKELQSKSGKDQQEKSRKLPDETELPGKAPPKDNKKPGGGDGGGETIG